MTVAAGPVNSQRTAPARSPADVPGPVRVPRLAEGVELLGEYQGSGYSQPPSLVRRADGQVIQMSALLYGVTCRIDGCRGPAGIADLVSGDLGRSLTADQVRYLITAKLLPLGIVAAEGAPAAPPKARPLFALRARGTLLPGRAANAAGVLLRPLFRWPVVAAVAVTVAAVDYWLFAVHGLGAGVQQVLRNPTDLLIVVGLSVVSAVFHECGHAAGCRYGGARPGVIGVGIYLVWPSFFTNVTDSYRLSRAGRLRTDLGGLYFNLIFMLALAGIYVGTSDQVLLLVIAVTHLEMLDPEGGLLAVRLLLRGFVPQRFDQGGDVAQVFGRQLVDAGDQELLFPVARVLAAGRGLVVVVQAGGFGRGGADRRDRHVEALGERVDGGRARGAGQVPCGGEGVDGRPRQPAAAGYRAVGPASFAQPLLDQALQRIECGLHRRRGGVRLLCGEVWPVPRRVRRHDHQPSPSPPGERSRESSALTYPRIILYGDDRTARTSNSVHQVRGPAP